jgi:thiol-disulfide isomerase/thioredoxin
MKKLISVFAVLLLLLAAGCAAVPSGQTASPSQTVPSPSASDATAAVNQVSPEETAAVGILGAFKATDIDGNPVDQSVFKDHKLTMVNVWATFCGPCINEMPELGKLNHEYADKGVQVVGIVVDAAGSDGKLLPDMVETAKEIVKQTDADYLHLLPSEDLNSALLNSVTAVPTTVFVDEDGNQVGETIVGSHSGEEWAGIIDDLLKEVG